MAATIICQTNNPEPGSTYNKKLIGILTAF